jgi:hypothetical protein
MGAKSYPWLLDITRYTPVMFAASLPTDARWHIDAQSLAPRHHRIYLCDVCCGLANRCPLAQRPCDARWSQEPDAFAALPVKAASVEPTSCRRSRNGAATIAADKAATVEPNKALPIKLCCNNKLICFQHWEAQGLVCAATTSRLFRKTCCHNKLCIVCTI